MAVHLLLGGARSGKSRAAQDLALASGLRPTYVATATVPDDDEEWAARVARHQADRDERWTTVEEPDDLVGVLAAHRGPERFLVVDCLTLWLSNLLAAGADVDARVDELVAALDEGHGPVAVVANEVGMGLVPMHPVGRAFRDAQGRCNQRVAAVADRVTLHVAGLPLTLKG